jgi:hypothetical protein
MSYGGTNFFVITFGDNDNFVASRASWHLTTPYRRAKAFMSRNKSSSSSDIVILKTDYLTIINVDINDVQKLLDQTADSFESSPRTTAANAPGGGGSL